MVDPNPARGMPLQLQRYWLAGKGAAKIRWGVPGDFNRCVRNLRKYFPKNPEGLCNILHTKSLGAPPGKGHGDMGAVTAATALLAAMPSLGSSTWAGPIAPIGRPTGEPRQMRLFEPGALQHRTLPLPLMHRRQTTSQGHSGAVTVGRVLGITYGPDEMGQDWAYAWGDWLDEDIVPEVREAKYLVAQGVAGPSVDPGGQVAATLNPETGAHHMLTYTIGGVTLVSIPAFASMRLRTFEGDDDWPDDDPDLVMRLDDDDECGCHSADGSESFAVNASGWRGLPLAARQAPFDNDDAVKRIGAWAGWSAQGADVEKLRRAFLWHDPNKPETDPTSYRLPVGDIINGRLTMVYHAIYAAAALISGAHGGLPDVPDEDKNQLRNVITEIYDAMAQGFNDSSIRAPWDRPENEGKEFAMDGFAMDEKKPFGDVPYADPGYQKDGVYRYPIDTLKHIRAAWSYINQASNAARYNAKQLAAIRGRIIAAAKKHGIEISEAAKPEMAADIGYPVAPPRAWFDNPMLTKRTPLTVEPDGRVFGHIAAWDECHRDYARQRECVLPPRSRQNYAPFHLGSVLTAEGDTIRVGKIVQDTSHASITLGYTAAVVHYDHTGDEIAVVRAGEDDYGLWVAGALVPEATPARVAKLRRSPISGDWRAVNGNLELTAALAVNVPAFPVYAMDGDVRLALVAAGTVEPPPDTYDDDESVRIISSLFASMREGQARQERIARLQELHEDEEIYRQRERQRRLAALQFAAAPEPEEDAAPAAESAPADGEPAEEEALGTPEQEAAERQANARFSVVRRPDGTTVTPPSTAVADQGAAAPAPAGVQQPAPTPAPTPVTTPAST